MGPVVWAQPDDYGVPQFLEALQNGPYVAVLGVFRTPHLALSSSADTPLHKREATYNQWAFEVHSLRSWYQEDVIQEGIV